MGREPSPSFCVVPWLHRLVDERGCIKVCCVAEGPENFLTGDDGRRLRVQDASSDHDIFNHPRLKALRRAMLSGEWDPICRRCQSAEAAGGSSSRTGRNHHFAHRVDELCDATQPDGTIERPVLRHLDLRLGNTCNLTCRMCSPGASTLWIDSYNRVQPEAYQLSARRLDELRQVAWVKDRDVWRRFSESLPSIEWLHFAGGEPMIVPEMIEALERCVVSGRAGDIDLSYTTNLTRVPDAVAALWPRFKSVSLTCSVDGFGALNEYIRRPSRWADIDRHLRLLDAHFHAWNLSEVFVSPTVQVYNVLDLDKLYAYLRSGFAHVLPLPLLNPLTWPDYLSVRHLPAHAKETAADRLRAERSRPEYRSTRLDWLVRSIDPVLALLDDAADAERWREFLTFLTASEREFSDSLTVAAPELAEVCRE